MSSSDQLTLSPSIQMYLVTILRLRRDNDPVPISELAQELAVSPVSANEMSRKLQEQGMLTYQPYRGVALTAQGEQRACYVLRRHRLWEVFLVDELGMDIIPAHAAACQLEHSTPDSVSDRLDEYLGQPTVNPEGLPVPRSDGAGRSAESIAQLTAGQRGIVCACEGDRATRSFLAKPGIRPGAQVIVLATDDESMLIEVRNKRIALSNGLAATIIVDRRPAAAEVAESVSTVTGDCSPATVPETPPAARDV